MSYAPGPVPRFGIRARYHAVEVQEVTAGALRTALPTALLTGGLIAVAQLLALCTNIDSSGRMQLVLCG